MKRLFSALLTTVLFAASAFAAGPWDSGIPGNPNRVNPANVNGTYQGTLKGKNLSGLMTFVSGSNGQVVVSSSTYRGVSITTGSGYTIVTPVYSVSTQTVSTNGYATFFFEGKMGQANLNTFVNLGGRTISGLIEGAGSRGIPVTLVRPADNTAWTLTDSAYFDGTFDARFSSSWASNSFSGKGSVTVTKFDYNGFNADLATNPTTANPHNHIVTIPLSVAVSGVKTSNVVPAIFTPPVLNSVPPSITP